ncbi:hypothetical protein COT48_04075 [Candidatus Woesearchaeota archaeon CG08_land_8_20_14_0_20_47_9]|nr:MAG: hypothetical protein AUJ69_02110 [Candidatus Woesearchaeota archaeon CG1_02_47_18]PIO03631.1 MAG: hypothetical protein COT48_04075 [Candidatus Woesearchaeota archaeon CG08_land_8_20_14_0_20_47_9]
MPKKEVTHSIAFLLLTMAILFMADSRVDITGAVVGVPSSMQVPPSTEFFIGFVLMVGAVVMVTAGLSLEKIVGGESDTAARGSDATKYNNKKEGKYTSLTNSKKDPRAKEIAKVVEGIIKKYDSATDYKPPKFSYKKGKRRLIEEIVIGLTKENEKNPSKGIHSVSLNKYTGEITVTGPDGPYLVTIDESRIPHAHVKKIRLLGAIPDLKVGALRPSL